MEDNNVEVLDEEKKEVQPEVKEEVKVETPKKKNSIGWIILVIILMIGCLIGGYFINESGILSSKEEPKEEKETKKEKKEETTEEKEEELDINSEQVTTLFENITNANRHYCGYYVIFKTTKITPNDISMEDRAAFMLHYVYKNLGDTEGKTYTKDEIEKVYKQLFGKDVGIQHGNVRGCPSFSYDSTKEIYTVGPSACGGTCGPYTTTGRVRKAVKKGDVITLDVRMLFALSEMEKWYADYEYTKEVQVPKNSKYDGPDPDAVIDQGTLYKVTFKLEDGNYVFVSSEPVK